MHIDKITIKNFRSLKNTSLAISNFSVLLGANNSGKSNILRALEFFLTPAMLFNPAEYPVDAVPSHPVEIEVAFSNLTKKETGVFQDQIRADGALVLKRVAMVGNDHPQNNGYRSIATDGTISELPSNLIAPGNLPEFFFVPALFDIKKELTVNSSTYFGRLLKRFIGTSPFLLEMGRILAEQEYSLNTRDVFGQDTGLSMLEQKLDKDLEFFNGKIKIAAPQLTVEQLYELGTTVTVDDGVSTDVTRKGHGLQRALVFAFIRQWIKALAAQPNVAFVPEPNRSESVIFAIEEPELNIHPHGLRKIVSDLNELSENPNHQVIICSHSSYFVDLSKPKAIAVVRKSTVAQGTQVSQCLGELFPGDNREEAVKRFNATAYFNPDRAELFFAERIILVEGQTEAKLLPYLAHLLGVYRPGCSIIDCDGKYNLRLYMEVLNRFGFSYVVIHDEDPLPLPPAEPSNAQKGIFNENARIATLAKENSANLVLISKPGFEAVAQIEVEPNKPFSAYEKFKDRKAEDIPGGLKELVIKAFGSKTTNVAAKSFYYFAYGSNLKLSEIHLSCPSAKRKCSAKLPGHELVFPRKSTDRNCGVASVETLPGSDVWGGIYEISENERASLESREGFQRNRPQSDNSYLPANLTVFELGDLARPVEVITFKAIPEADPPLPSSHYKGLLIDGAYEWNLDPNYITRLEQIAATNP